MQTKVHINLTQGILEAEGDADFVREMYASFKTDLHALAMTKKANTNSPTLITQASTTEINSDDVFLDEQKGTSKKVSPKRAPTKKVTYNNIKDLATGMPDEADSIFDYVSRYNPINNIERNLVFTKYLNEQHPTLPVTADALYTCYTNANLKPAEMKSSLSDTSKASKGFAYLDTADPTNITISHKGTVRLHELKQATAVLRKAV